MSYTVEFSGAAVKELKKIPKKQRLMILTWIKKNLDGCDNPRLVHGGKQLQGTDSGWRWHVGSYRVLGKIMDDVLQIKVVRVGHRQGVYSNLPKV